MSVALVPGGWKGDNAVANHPRADVNRSSYLESWSGMLSIAPIDLHLSVGSHTAAAGRETNEDAVLVTQLPEHEPGAGPGFLLAVADGMGGHQRGEVASQTAIELLNDLFARDRPEDIAQALKQAYRRANEAIFQQAALTPDQGPMGTTLVSAVVSGKYVTIANVGDSRAYLVRANQLTQITQDHSLVAEQVAQGQLTEEAARRSPQRNIITQSLGTSGTLDRRMPSIYELVLLPEDRLLLCSDGFFDVLMNEDYVSALISDDPQESAAQLVTLASQRGASDNVSAVIVAASPSLAFVQREQIGLEIAEQRRTSSLLLPVAMLLIVLIAIAIGIFFYLG